VLREGAFSAWLKEQDKACGVQGVGFAAAAAASAVDTPCRVWLLLLVLLLLWCAAAASLPPTCFMVADMSATDVCGQQQRQQQQQQQQQSGTTGHKLNTYSMQRVCGLDGQHVCPRHSWYLSHSTLQGGMQAALLTRHTSNNGCRLAWVSNESRTHRRAGGGGRGGG